ncbi:ABC transporter ATP-binding protein/permease [Dermabacteraceae bacterium TAE3-ERU27]|nr:ABC transporter ATP-binding protein/permease [Dermabacteraceae bacterium TAE3-ERU27]
MVIASQLTLAAGPWLIAEGIDTALPALMAGHEAPAIWISAGYLLITCLATFFTYALVRTSTVLGQQMLLELRRRVFRHTQRLSLEFHEHYTSGRVISRQTSDMETLRELLEFGLRAFAGSVLAMVFTAASILLLDLPTGLLMLAMLLPALPLTIWFQRASREGFRNMRTYSARLIVSFVETFGGIRAVQVFRKEKRNLEEYSQVASDYRDATLRTIMVFGIYQPLLRLIGAGTIAAILLLGGYRVLDGNMEVGVLLALVLYARRFFQPIDEIANVYNSLQSAVAALEKISGLLEQEPTVKEPEAPAELTHARGDIRFEDVSFRYAPDAPLVLKPFDLHIPAGQTVALVGQTGAGKSTLAKLVSRFYDVSGGSLKLDGIDVRDISAEDLHRNVVMVTQEAYLFSGTVGENIALGRPDASLEDIRLAARAIGAQRFIEDLPDGYDTDVNKRGGRVSAGQRQLISFARAFLANPAVLILDEATSSLDIPSERLVQEGLTKLLGNRTALIIAHRLSTVMIADRVLVVGGGGILEDGSPQELIARGGQFAALYQAWQDSLKEG